MLLSSVIARRRSRERAQILSRRLRVAGLLPAAALIGVFGAAGCSDVTGPQSGSTTTAASPPAAPAPPVPPGRLGDLGGSLHEATSHFVLLMDDQPRTRLEKSLGALAEHLSAGKVNAARTALAEAQALIDSYDSVTKVEIAPVALALEQIAVELSVL